MREAEFKAWLAANGANTEAGRSTRTHAVRTIEKNMAALGSPHSNLDEAWAADQFEQLRARLKELRQDFQAGGTDFRILMPESKEPVNRLSSWRSWLGQYGQFLGGAATGNSDADRIRRYVLETYIEPAREKEADTVDVLVRDVNEALRLNQAWPNICQALTGKKFLEMADVGAPQRIGANQSSATVFRFLLDGTAAAVTEGTEAPADPPIVLFDSQGRAYHPVRQTSRGGVTAYWVKPWGASSNRTEEMRPIDDDLDIVKAILIERLPARIRPTAGGAINLLKYGAGLLVRYRLRPDIAAAMGPDFSEAQGSTEMQSKPSQALNLILYGPPGTGKTYRTAAEAVKLCDGLLESDPLLIDPDRRAELKQRYDELVEARRIDFVTFHQSYSYEEFVEGLRPVQSVAPGEGAEVGSSGAGFSLLPEDGVFRRIAHRAAQSRGGGGGRFAIGDRRVFKLSIGEAANPEDDYLFEEAIAEGHALLGYDDIDWSDARFADREAFIAACARYDQEHPDNGRRPPTAQTGRVQCPMIFRNWVKEGDLVIVSKGNSKFRAVGEVVGDYEYAPRSTGVYSHRRKVNWLWIDPAGAPVDEIMVDKNFSMRALYLLSRNDLNIPALEAYIRAQLPGAGPAVPEPYVLIIDEINRGNISKIFGELITLIEPDKRAGQPNAIELRLPYSRAPFSVPANLHIVGTMNTADRSIALLDTALRRRFVFRELAPEPRLLPETIDGVPLRRVLETVNDRIEYLIDREHRIGHAFFLGEGGRDRAAIDATMRDKVIPLLQEYFFEDWGRIAAVLGERPGRGGGFLDCRKLRDPTGGEGDERESWSVRPVFADDAYDRLIGKPVVEAALEEAAE